MTVLKKGYRVFMPSLQAHSVLEQMPIVSVVGALLMLYVLTAAPSITWGNEGADSGELAAAVMTLGVAHPPGYPAYMMLGRLWLMLPLEGDPAYRLNLLSAVSAAIAVGGVMATIALIAPPLPVVARNIGAMAGGVLLGTTPLLWSQATITEVYAPGLAITVLIGYAIFRWHRSGRSSWWVGAWWGIGFGTGVLPQVALLLPGIVLVWLIGHQNSAVRWTLLKKGSVALGLGLLVFAYLPLRASADPGINWGNPTTVDSWWAHLTARQYHHLSVGEGDGRGWARMFSALVTVVSNIGVPSSLMAVVGGIVLSRIRHVALGYLGLIGLFAILLFAFYPVARSSAYLLPALYSVSIGAGVGIGMGCAVLMNRWAWQGTAIAIILLVWIRPRIPLPQSDIRHDDRAVTYAQTLLAALPPSAVLVSNHDECTFPLWYQQALGERPDVVVVDSRLLFYSWYRDQLAQRYPDIEAARWYPGGLQGTGRPLYALPLFVKEDAPFTPCSIHPLKQ